MRSDLIKWMVDEECGVAAGCDAPGFEKIIKNMCLLEKSYYKIINDCSKKKIYIDGHFQASATDVTASLAIIFS